MDRLPLVPVGPPVDGTPPDGTPPAGMVTFPEQQDWQVDRVVSINETLNLTMKACQCPYDGVVLCFHHWDHEPVDLIRFVIKYKPALPIAVLVEEYELPQMQLHLKGVVCQVVTPASLSEAFYC